MRLREHLNHVYPFVSVPLPKAHLRKCLIWIRNSIESNKFSCLRQNYHFSYSHRSQNFFAAAAAFLFLFSPNVRRAFAISIYYVRLQKKSHFHDTYIFNISMWKYKVSEPNAQQRIKYAFATSLLFRLNVFYLKVFCCFLFSREYCYCSAPLSLLNEFNLHFAHVQCKMKEQNLRHFVYSSSLARTATMLKTLLLLFVLLLLLLQLSAVNNGSSLQLSISIGRSIFK